MKMTNLVEIFDSLHLPKRVPGHGMQFSAHLIPSYEHHRVAQNVSGYPCLLIHATDTQTRRSQLPLELEHISILHDVECRVSNSDGTVEEAVFTVICCTTEDTTLHKYFLRVGSVLISTLGNQPTHADVNRSVQKLIELFQSISRPGKKPVRGLWAELFVINKISVILVNACINTRDNTVSAQALKD
jgi:hypothetical protein